MNFRWASTTLAIGFSTFVFLPESHAANLAAPPISEQVDQVTEWFSGWFNNKAQVAQTPSLPLISMSNCLISVTGEEPDTRSVYLKQESGGFPFRIRYYGFSPGEDGISLSVRSFKDNSSVDGICDLPSSERILDLSQILPESCDVELMWQSEPIRYVGNNAPEGCPTSFPGGKVVSEVEVFADAIFSTDRIFNSSGDLLFGEPIEFRRVTTPEPLSALVLIGLGLGYAALSKLG